MTTSLLSTNPSKNQPRNNSRGNLSAVSHSEAISPLHLVAPEGQLKVHTAPYRGSFSEVLSEAIRAAGLGSEVMIVQFLKGGVDQGPTGSISLCGRLEWLRPAISGCLHEPIAKEISELSRIDYHEAIEEVWKVCKKRLLDGELNQLVLDEVGLAVAFGLIKEEDLISTLEKRPKSTDVILTGPSIPSGIISMADQITELRSGF